MHFEPSELLIAIVKALSWPTPRFLDSENTMRYNNECGNFNWENQYLIKVTPASGVSFLSYCSDISEIETLCTKNVHCDKNINAGKLNIATCTKEDSNTHLSGSIMNSHNIAMWGQLIVSPFSKHLYLTNICHFDGRQRGARRSFLLFCFCCSFNKKKNIVFHSILSLRDAVKHEHSSTHSSLIYINLIATRTG